jgi:quercetin dioxygenase-like cupin family protein
MNTSTPKIPFQTIDWATIPKTEYPGDTGKAWWQTILFPGLRIRLVEYSPGYFANHWCEKGHVVYCIAGEFVSELNDGQTFFLQEGMTYVVSDNLSSHRSRTDSGVKLLIIDGDFLKNV